MSKDDQVHRPPQSTGTGNQVPRHILVKQLSGTFWGKSRIFVLKVFSSVPDKVFLNNYFRKSFFSYLKQTI